MAKLEWGEKHGCDSCGCRFYDLMREPPTCPKCGTVAAPAESKPRRPAPKAKPPAPVAMDRGSKLVEIAAKDDPLEASGVIEDLAELDEDDKDDKDDKDVAAVVVSEVDEASEAL